MLNNNDEHVSVKQKSYTDQYQKDKTIFSYYKKTVRITYHLITACMLNINSTGYTMILIIQAKTTPFS